MSQAVAGNYVWWLTARAAGIVALGLVTASVILGLAMAARVLPARRRAGAVRVHQHLALLSLAAIVGHGLALVADPWLKTGVSGVVVPFAIGYRPLWTAFGIIGAYLAAILGLSFYVRRQIGARLWRRMHRLTVLVYLFGLIHALGAGTDASIPLVRDLMLASSIPILVLFGLRIARARTGARRKVSGSRRSAPQERGPAFAAGGARPAPRAAALHLEAVELAKEAT